ncbi:septal ring lytic transglycosylase RlpA family protein [Zooshikella harenae]|uniref:Endolytic peptidoglycan transglycosylase RlpA n=1 Tax=Zooshikella harenae TaxID=2827238 RepID=A0ABS5ZGU7_9GAMM|nr:septal ring lytic transglycosylase RlpA family protein [Zooshikella harenae]MBU2713286.1 septal ring lytic transglycosylase RlpA family protein [Zooshikella harenae]
MPLKDVDDGAPNGSFDASQIPDAVPQIHKGPVKNSPYTVLGKRYYPLKTAVGYQAQGVASWYGTKFHGKATAIGETYNMYSMTAAHKTLPIPSYVRVTNLKNGRSAVVRVNDRGPFAKGREIDLSYAAALKLGFQKQGTTRVRVEGIDPRTYKAGNAPTSNKPRNNTTAQQSTGSSHLLSSYQASTQSKAGMYAGTVSKPQIASIPATHSKKLFLQVAALQDQQSAFKLRYRLQQLTGMPVKVVEGTETRRPLHKVRIGPLPSSSVVNKIQQQLNEARLGKPHLVVE